MTRRVLWGLFLLTSLVHCGETNPPHIKGVTSEDRASLVDADCPDADFTVRPLRHGTLRAITRCINRSPTPALSQLEQYVRQLSDEELDSVAELFGLLVDDPETTIQLIQILKKAWGQSETFEDILTALQDPNHPLTVSLRNWRETSEVNNMSEALTASTIDLLARSGWGHLIEGAHDALRAQPAMKSTFLEWAAPEGPVSQWFLSDAKLPLFRKSFDAVAAAIEGGQVAGLLKLLRERPATRVAELQKLQWALQKHSDPNLNAIPEIYKEDVKNRDNIHAVAQLLAGARTMDPEFLRHLRDLVTGYKGELQGFSDRLLIEKIGHQWVDEQFEAVWKNLYVDFAKKLPPTTSGKDLADLWAQFSTAPSTLQTITTTFGARGRALLGPAADVTIWDKLGECIATHISLAAPGGPNDEKSWTPAMVEQWAHALLHVNVKPKNCGGVQPNPETAELRDVLTVQFVGRIIPEHYGKGYALHYGIENLLDFFNLGNMNRVQAQEEFRSGFVPLTEGHTSGTDVIPVVDRLDYWAVRNLPILGHTIREMVNGFLFRWMDFDGLMRDKSWFEEGLYDPIIKDSSGDVIDHGNAIYLLTKEAPFLHDLLMRVFLYPEFQDDGTLDAIEPYLQFGMNFSSAHALIDAVGDLGLEGNRASYEHVIRSLRTVLDPKSPLLAFAEAWMQSTFQKASANDLIDLESWTQHSGVTLRSGAVDYLAGAFQSNDQVKARYACLKNLFELPGDQSLLLAVAQLDTDDFRHFVSFFKGHEKAVREVVKLASSPKASEFLDLLVQWTHSEGNGVEPLLVSIVNRMSFINKRDFDRLANFALMEIKQASSQRWLERVSRALVNSRGGSPRQFKGGKNEANSRSPVVWSTLARDARNDGSRRISEGSR